VLAENGVARSGRPKKAFCFVLRACYRLVQRPIVLSGETSPVMRLIDLVLLACNFSNPTACREYHIPLQSDQTLTACTM
jgi:hypothetical protein